MSTILPVEEYDAIRERLGVEYPNVLSDQVIDMAPFMPIADAQVRAQVPHWEAIVAAEGDDLHILKAALVATVSALLVPRMENKLRPRERMGDYTAGDIDWQRLRVELEQEAASYIAQVNDAEERVPPVFTVIGVSRQRRKRVGGGKPWRYWP